MISISSNLNIMIKAAEKASKSIIRDFGEVENYKFQKKVLKILLLKQIDKLKKS